MIENRINKNFNGSFKNFLDCVESSIDFQMITSIVESAILLLFPLTEIGRNVSDFLRLYSIYDFMDKMLGQEAENYEVIKEIPLKLVSCSYKFCIEF